MINIQDEIRTKITIKINSDIKSAVCQVGYGWHIVHQISFKIDNDILANTWRRIKN